MLIGRILLVVALTAVFGAAPVRADTLLGLYAGVGTWMQEFDGDITTDVSTVDVVDDLALDDDDNAVFYVALEHGVPALPNVRGQYFNIDMTGSNRLARTIQFNGQTFGVSERVDAVLEFEQSDAIFYYQVLDNFLTLDVGVAISALEAAAEVSAAFRSERVEFDEIVPMLYGQARVDLPFSGGWAAVQVQGIGYDGSDLIEYNAHLGWESGVGLGIEAGWRAVHFGLDAFDEFDGAEIDITGPYAALNFHF